MDRPGAKGSQSGQNEEVDDVGEVDDVAGTVADQSDEASQLDDDDFDLEEGDNVHTPPREVEHVPPAVYQQNQPRVMISGETPQAIAPPQIQEQYAPQLQFVQAHQVTPTPPQRPVPQRASRPGSATGGGLRQEDDRYRLVEDINVPPGSYGVEFVAGKTVPMDSYNQNPTEKVLSTQPFQRGSYNMQSLFLVKEKTDIAALGLPAAFTRSNDVDENIGVTIDTKNLDAELGPYFNSLNPEDKNQFDRYTSDNAVRDELIKKYATKKELDVAYEFCERANEELASKFGFNNPLFNIAIIKHIAAYTRVFGGAENPLYAGITTASDTKKTQLVERLRQEILTNTGVDVDNPQGTLRDMSTQISSLYQEIAKNNGLYDPSIFRVTQKDYDSSKLFNHTLYGVNGDPFTGQRLGSLNSITFDLAIKAKLAGLVSDGRVAKNDPNLGTVKNLLNQDLFGKSRAVPVLLSAIMNRVMNSPAISAAYRDLIEKSNNLRALLSRDWNEVKGVAIQSYYTRYGEGVHPDRALKFVISHQIDEINELRNGFGNILESNTDRILHDIMSQVQPSLDGSGLNSERITSEVTLSIKKWLELQKMNLLSRDLQNMQGLQLNPSAPIVLGNQRPGAAAGLSRPDQLHNQGRPRADSEIIRDPDIVRGNHGTNRSLPPSPLNEHPLYGTRNFGGQSYQGEFSDSAFGAPMHPGAPHVESPMEQQNGFMPHPPAHSQYSPRHRPHVAFNSGVHAQSVGGTNYQYPLNNGSYVPNNKEWNSPRQHAAQYGGPQYSKTFEPDSYFVGNPPEHSLLHFRHNTRWSDNQIPSSTFTQKQNAMRGDSSTGWKK